MLLPEKTVERLSVYRRVLFKCLNEGKTHIYSHELAKLLNITAVQVRRDIMFIGYSSSQKKGYYIKKLIEVIGHKLDSRRGQNVAIIGMGNLGKAITGYLVGKKPKLNIVAAFDIDPKKINKKIAGISCFSIEEIGHLINELNISIALLTVPPEAAEETTTQLVDAGIKGILNFTSVSINVPSNVYLEEYDMITYLEKVAYFSKNRK